MAFFPKWAGLLWNRESQSEASNQLNSGAYFEVQELKCKESIYIWKSLNLILLHSLAFDTGKIVLTYLFVQVIILTLDFW